MSQKYCIIHANCQGDPLQKLLMLHPQFGAEYSITKYTNYLREEIPAHELAACALFLYQPLGEKWNDLASAALLGRVNTAAVTLPIPNMLFKGYWPFWTNKSRMNYGDFFLEHLLGMGLEKQEVLYICMHTVLERKYDLAGMFAASIEMERAKEEGCVVQTVDSILERYKSEPLFNTINHPNRRLVLHVAEGILSALGYAPLPQVLVEAFTDPYPEFELPIHPQVAAFHGLSFGGSDTRYNIYGTLRTYEEYVNLYIDCHLHGIDDFISYLHLV